MDSSAIVVAVIGAIGAIIVGFMQSFKKEAREANKTNSEDHAIVQSQLRMIFKTVNRVDDKLEKHINQHEEGTLNGQVIRRDTKTKA
jgi:type II secretory pathway pseudopilin PulG